MTKIAELLDRGKTLSFEFFPPKTDKGRDRLRETIAELEPLEPSFASVTYGAGGSTRERTVDAVTELNESDAITVMPHLTCVGHKREELTELIGDYGRQGIENVLALHGDLPKDAPDMEPGDLKRAAELVELVREVGDFSVGVAAHPEGHPLAPDMESDRQHQAAKLKVADFGVTQFFFRVEDYLRFVDEMERRGVETPIIAGVIPITDANQIQRFAAMSGADMPSELVERLDAYADDPDEVRRIGVEVATDLSDRLLAEGAPGLHIYTLNRAEAPRAVHENLELVAA